MTRTLASAPRLQLELAGYLGRLGSRRRAALLWTLDVDPASVTTGWGAVLALMSVPVRRLWRRLLAIDAGAPAEMAEPAHKWIRWAATVTTTVVSGPSDGLAYSVGDPLAVSQAGVVVPVCAINHGDTRLSYAQCVVWGYDPLATPASAVAPPEPTYELRSSSVRGAVYALPAGTHAIVAYVPNRAPLVVLVQVHLYGIVGHGRKESAHAVQA